VNSTLKRNLDKIADRQSLL